MSDVLDLDLLKANKDKKRPHLSCVVQGLVKTSALYDTGADITCMSLKTFRDIPINKRPPKLVGLEPLRVKGASGRVLESTGTYDLELSFQDKKKVIQRVMVFKELNAGMILGMDLITDHALTYLPSQKKFIWGDPEAWYQGRCTVAKQTKIGPFVVAPVTVKLKTVSGCLAGSQHQVLGQVGHSENPFLSGGPYLMQANKIGQSVMMIHNCSPVEVTLERDDIIGYLENISDCDVSEINPDYVQEIGRASCRERV